MQDVNGKTLIQSPVEKTKEYEKKQAAYALNLCMVSISQIIDYNDINILEQEYDSILNNLNLEHMPKDEALLDILRQMLDTITFFRIQEVEKTFVEKEYQQKLKSAVLQGISQIGMVGAGIATFVKNPVQGALAIASTVGSTYINYRKNREEYASNQERQLWQLQRAAIEQFNGLRRELFTTAWRLAATYDFPDEYRLTERQIKQYNEILLDKDVMRRYERLSAVSENFKAYPPFWYYFGNTANEASRIEKLGETTRLGYKEKAKEYYSKYLENEEMNLLREDQMVSFCALEYIDILDRDKDTEKIDSLLDIASKYAGNSNDILQLCAIARIKINKKEKAAELLRYLINEDYNRIMNAQFLSAIYADLYKSCTDEDEKQKRNIQGQYYTLGMRVDTKYLYELSTDNKSEEDMEREFLERQKCILKKKYTLVLRQFVKKYRIMYNQVIPVPDERKDYPESYFAEDTTEACTIRSEGIKNIFESGGKVREHYLLRLEEANVELSYLNVLNQMFRAVRELIVISAEIEEDLKGCIKTKLSEKKDVFESLHKKLVNREFEFNDYVKLCQIKFGNLTGNYFNKLKELLKEMINSIDNESEIADFENNLAAFCLLEGFHAPEILYENEDELQIKDEEDKDIFSADILGVGAVKDAEIHKKREEMQPIIKESLQSITRDRSKVDCYTEWYDLSKYFSKRAMGKNSYIQKKALAIIDDKTWFDFDLVLTVNGIIPIIKNKGKECVEYNKVEWKDEALKIGEFSYKNQAIDLNQLLKLFTKLKEYQPQNEEKRAFDLGGKM